MKKLAVLLSLCMMLSSNAAFALVHTTIWAQLEFGFSFAPGPGDFLTLDGPAWSVDPRVTFVTEPTGTFLKVTFPEDEPGGLPSGVAAFPASSAPDGDINDALAFVVLTGPPAAAREIRQGMVESIPEPSTVVFLLGALSAMVFFGRQSPSVKRALRPSNSLRTKRLPSMETLA